MQADKKTQHSLDDGRDQHWNLLGPDTNTFGEVGFHVTTRDREGEKDAGQQRRKEILLASHELQNDEGHPKL